MSLQLQNQQRQHIFTMTPTAIFVASWLLLSTTVAQSLGDTTDVQPHPLTLETVPDTLLPTSPASGTSVPIELSCSPTAALGLGLLLPGGGQFYAGQFLGGAQAVVSEGLLAWVLYRSGSSTGSLLSFIVTKRLIEGLFARRACSRRVHSQHAATTAPAADISGFADPAGSDLRVGVAVRF
jgi:hypothetical protein